MSIKSRIEETVLHTSLVSGVFSERLFSTAQVILDNLIGSKMDDKKLWKYRQNVKMVYQNGTLNGSVQMEIPNESPEGLSSIIQGLAKRTDEMLKGFNRTDGTVVCSEEQLYQRELLSTLIRFASDFDRTIDLYHKAHENGKLNEYRQVEPDNVVDYSGPLTKRELEVLGKVSNGLTNKQIAGELVLSAHTIKFHLGSITSKLGYSGRGARIKVSLWYAEHHAQD